MKHLKQHNILTDSQHGFRAKRSTDTHLIQAINNMYKSVNKKETVDIWLYWISLRYLIKYLIKGEYIN